MKRLALFGATVLFPCGLLVIFGYIMVRQDRELAARHTEDRQRAAVAERQRQRLGRLEQLKRAAAEDFFAGRKPSAEFAALVINDTVRFPWEDSPAASPVLDACEGAEFAGNRLPEAIACYRRALQHANRLIDKANARLLLGRALAKARETGAATENDRELLQAPFALHDDQGVPFAYYAGDRLLRESTAAAVVAARFQREPPNGVAHSPAAAYLLKSIADRLRDPGLNAAAAAAIEFTRNLESLRGDLPALLPALRRDAPEPGWIEHGAWQVGLAKAPESGKELLVAIASSRLPSGAPPSITGASSTQTGTYLVSLCLVFLIAVSGAFLLWRDVRRDLELAALRSQFVSSVSHELKTPLTAIRMFAETLRMRPACASVTRDEYLDTIVNESERLSRLVDNVLDFSKTEQGTKLYHFSPTTAGAVLDAVERAVRYPLQQAGFALRMTSTEPLPELNADSDALQQAVLNLVMNAMKYSSERKEIELEARRDAGAVVISVRDYGIGIPVEYRRRIFERFFRVPSPENQCVPGAGLGLTLVAHIARAHGGAVTVDSTPGAGSLFALRLPVEQRS